MLRRNLKLVSSQLPEVLLLKRLDDVRNAWLALLWTWFLPQAWFTWCAALDRYEGQRIRTMRRR
jgi:hypothetical protein